MTRLNIHTEWAAGDTLRVLACGEIDLAAHRRLLAAVAEAVAKPGVRLIEMDLTSVTFLDAAGVGTLVAARNMAATGDARLRVRGATGLVLQVLEVCGVAELLGATAGG